jgi:two-component system sensor histidine kinase CpxA
MAALAAVALLCWWPFVRGVTGSIRQMDHATEQIAQGRFDRHVILERRDELGHLGEQINRMAGRLAGFVKHQKRFLGDIAHELSAPIARIQFALGILEQRVDSPQQTHVAALRDEIQEMSALVNELLAFSKAGMQPDQAPLKSVELAPIVARAISHQVPGSGAIQADIPPRLFVMAHEPYLLRAISNLLRNALRYAGEAGPIVVSARAETNAEGSPVTLTVADCGPGLPEESLDEVFAPFYRPEASRSRDTGGAGLGLAIVKSCVEACRGTVVCRNRKPSGLEVAISLIGAEASPAQS